jgi:ubiquinone/menaquinone biosynthesis C-methylase UbiE
MSLYLEAIAAMEGGSLHPGGFSHTLKLLNKISLSTEDIVLDIGCGTGRTACYLAKTCGAHIFALDNSEKMLAKARSRAYKEGADVHFVLGDALDMPFRDETVDMILLESVLIFLPVQDVLKECRRVLKKRGILVDVESQAKESLPSYAREQIKSICGLPQIPTFKEWVEHFERAGFEPVIVNQRKYPGPLDNLKEMLYPDTHQTAPVKLSTNRDYSKVLWQFKTFILKNRHNLGLGTFILRKA